MNNKPKPRAYSALPARPIMVYPLSKRQRELFAKAAKVEQRKLSNFVCWTMTQYIHEKRLLGTPEERWELAVMRCAENRKRYGAASICKWAGYEGTANAT